MPIQYKLYCLDNDNEVDLVPGYHDGHPALALYLNDYENSRTYGPFLIHRSDLVNALQEIDLPGILAAKVRIEGDGEDWCEVCCKAEVQCTNNRCYPCHRDYCTPGRGMDDDTPHSHERLWPKSSYTIADEPDLPWEAASFGPRRGFPPCPDGDQ